MEHVYEMDDLRAPEGVLLDTAPEPEGGAWNSLKSSIATNPGSSGGPLLNEQPALVGIVQSRKDDVCCSLPMSEVSLGKAVLHQKTSFGFTVFSKRPPDSTTSIWIATRAPASSPTVRLSRACRSRIGRGGPGR